MVEIWPHMHSFVNEEEARGGSSFQDKELSFGMKEFDRE